MFGVGYSWARPSVQALKSAHEAAVDSSHGQAVITFTKGADTDGISVRRADSGDVQIAWQVS